ncbi:MAG TPA: MtnX-like HAD-IB family phosphatase [Terriglobia bacterium]|nr:MtnX-like HAD-IB family phosphatase [Terriglobia bacterium]
MTDAPSEPRPIIFSDFDGTITQIDVTDAILEQLADPAWHAVEDEWTRGEIGSRECLARQMALVHASRPELDALIDAIPVDPGFAAFYRFTEARALPFYVLSDGFDYVIRRVLRRTGVDGILRNGRHLFSSALQVRAGKLTPSFPHPRAGCEHGCATCKPRIMRRLSRGHHPVVFIGDGFSDCFAVHAADVVFAKDKLLAYCHEHGIAAEPFETFADVQARLVEDRVALPDGSLAVR